MSFSNDVLKNCIAMAVKGAKLKRFQKLIFVDCRSEFAELLAQALESTRDFTYIFEF